MKTKVCEISGRSIWDGVVFYGNGKECKALRNKDGTITTAIKGHNRSKVLRFIHKWLPFIRGFLFAFEIIIKIFKLFKRKDHIYSDIDRLKRDIGEQTGPDDLEKIISSCFEYHASEHMVINTYIEDEDINIENVRTKSSLSTNCGTVWVGTYIFYFIVVVLLCLFFGEWYIFIAGISLIYEIKKLGDFKLMRFLIFPGMILQETMVKIPSDEQLEVAITAFNCVIENNKFVC